MIARISLGVVLVALLAGALHAAPLAGKRVLGSRARTAPLRTRGTNAVRTRAARPTRERSRFRRDLRDWYRFPKPAHLATVRRLVLDPGHGGDNQGAVGYWGTREKALTLAIARLMRDYIETNSDVKVSLTREYDRAIGLRERARWANGKHADAFVSLHCNSAERHEARGMEVWYLSTETSQEVIHDLVRREEGLPVPSAHLPEPWSVGAIVAEMAYSRAHERSAAMAEALAHGLHWGRPDSPVRGVKQAAFGVLKEARMPAVVLEVGFISHREEGRELLGRKAQIQLSRGVLRGLILLDRQQAGRGLRRRRPGSGATMPAGPARPRIGSPK